MISTSSEDPPVASFSSSRRASKEALFPFFCRSADLRISYIISRNEAYHLTAGIFKCTIFHLSDKLADGGSFLKPDARNPPGQTTQSREYVHKCGTREQGFRASEHSFLSQIKIVVIGWLDV